jgi:CRP-like cAMP-binding protein
MGRSAQLRGPPDLSDSREETALPRRSATQHELARVELLAGLPGETLAKLGQRMERHDVAPGTVLVREGEYDDHFYILLS